MQLISLRQIRVHTCLNRHNFDTAHWTTVTRKGSPCATGPLCCLSVCNVDVLSSNGWMDQDATWYADRPRPRRHCVRWEPSFPRKGAQQPPHFAVHVHCDQMAGFIRMALGTPKERGTAPPPLFGPLCSCTVAHVSNC